jgi:RNA polymerase sigma-70 factor (ECF subfamily)
MEPEDSADVLQEVFRAVAQAIAGFRRDRPGDTFRGWLRTIARNKIHDHYRARAGQPEAVGGTDAYQRFAQVPADEPEASVEPGPLSKACRVALDLIRAEFEPRTWQAFWLATMDQRAADEVARELGMSTAAVRQANYRVRHRLRQELGDLP